MDFSRAAVAAVRRPDCRAVSRKLLARNARVVGLDVARRRGLVLDCSRRRDLDLWRFRFAIEESDEPGARVAPRRPRALIP